MPQSSALARTRAILINRYTLPVTAALAGLWLLFLRYALNDTTSFALFQDNEFFIGPVLSSMSETLRTGEWPLRMDTALGGLPLYNFSQLTAFYPFYLLTLPLYESPAETMHSMHMITLAHLLVMEINTYIFLRVIGASRLPAVTAAALMTFNTNNFNYSSWINIVAPYAWFPLFLAGIICMAQGRSRRVSAAMMVTGISMLTLASPAQPLIHALFMAGVFCVFYCWHCRSGDSRGIFLQNFFKPLCGIGVLSFLPVSPALVPAAAELKDMIRWIGAFPPIYGTERIPFEAFQVEQLALTDMGGVLFRFRSMAVGHQFIGVALTGLALIKMFSPRRTWIVNALTFVAVYAFLSAFGSNLGLGYVNYWIPLLNKIREPTRFLFLFQFAIGALAALALEELRQIADAKTGMRLLRRQWLALGVLLGAALLTWLFFHGQIVPGTHPGASMLVFCLLLALTWGMRKFALPARGLLLTGCWSAATLGALAVEAPWYPPAVTASEYETRNFAPLDEALRRVVELDPSHDYRLAFDGSVDRQSAAMLASYHGIRTLEAYFNPVPREYFDELYYAAPRDDNYFHMLGAKYLLCKDCPPSAIAGYGFTENIAGYDLYTAAESLPYTFSATAVTGTFEHLPDFLLAAAQLPLAQPFLFVRASEAAALRLPAAGNASDAAACSMKEEHRGATRVEVSVDCNGPAVVVLNNLHDGNWRASVDGTDALALKVNGNQIGAEVAAGMHVVRFQYRPSIVTGTMIVSMLSLLLLIYLLCRGRLYAGRRTT